ncbi:MAG: hypothetical protein K9M57_09200 [Phycisphaerae bacterium]|nr:hypothetical protein [Phycisphaerae bacterium]
MKSTIGQQLKAMGRYSLPSILSVNDSVYILKKIFKHDFFAITSLYERQGLSHQTAGGSPPRIVLKVNRKADFLGLPFQWLGVGICENEIANLSALKGIRGIPRYLGRYENVGLIYEYIEGVSLDEKPALPDDFFDQLEILLKEVHRRHIAYIDMNKRGNILLGCDNHPHLIDFQISQRIYWAIFPIFPLSRWLLRIFQREDFYHLNKHKRRLAGHLMGEQEKRESCKRSFSINLHRFLSRPLTRFRRKILGFLYKKGLLIDDVGGKTAETDPSRWA